MDRMFFERKSEVPCGMRAAFSPGRKNGCVSPLSVRKESESDSIATQEQAVTIEGKDSFEQFVDNVVRNIERHGFPDKRVSLPLERMYEAAHGKGLNFNKVLASLEERGIYHEKTNDKVIFFQKSELPDMAAQFQAAKEMFEKMTPEERQRLEDLYRNLTPEQMEEIKKQAQSLGLGLG